MLADAESPRRVGLAWVLLPTWPQFFLLKNGDDLLLTWQ